MLCGVYCIQYIQRQEGKRISKERVKKIAGTNRNGTRSEGMVEALTTLGYKAFFKDRLSWSKAKSYVDRGYYVIPAWWSILDYGDKTPTAAPADGHWSVIESMTRDTIVLYDPDVPEPRTLSKAFWMAHWWDYDISPENERHSLIQAAVIAKVPRKKGGA